MKRGKQMDFDQLIPIAKRTLNPRKISETTSVGMVAAVLLTKQGNIYRGVCIDTPCSIGFCAEYAAIAAMITAGENQVAKLVAVSADRGILPPCGRCRELLYQICPDNLQCEIQLKDRIVTLEDLLPERWNE